MQRFIIERDVPGMGANDKAGFCDAATISNTAIRKLAPKVQWVTSYVVANGTYCIYLAEDEAAIREHARLSGLPANRITPVVTIIDPTSELQA
jgi:hypothetical protein